MLGKKKPEYKIMFHNYQFYENAALLEFLEKQKAKGYVPCGFVGESCNIIKFCYEQTKETGKSYAVFCKHFNKQTEDEIDKIKTGQAEVLCENSRYLIVRVDSGEGAETGTDCLESRQNTFPGIPVKKSAALIFLFLVISVISFILKLFLLEKGNLYFNRLCLALYLVLFFNFLIYFVGDIHDMIAGKGVRNHGILYFSGRTKFKDRLFFIGDILKWATLLASIGVSLAIFLIGKDLVLAVDVVKMWLIYGTVGLVYRLRLQRSYVSLLTTEMFLITLSFI